MKTLVSSTALEASNVLSAKPCALYELFVHNTGADQFIQLHDAVSVPADTAVPKIVFNIPADFSGAVPIGMTGIPFRNGCVVCNSSTVEEKTLGAADCFFSAVVD